MNKSDSHITPEARAYMSSLGKKGGKTNKKKGPAYFKWVVSHRKNMKNKVDPSDPNGEMIDNNHELVQ